MDKIPKDLSSKTHVPSPDATKGEGIKGDKTKIISQAISLIERTEHSYFFAKKWNAEVMGVEPTELFRAGKLLKEQENSSLIEKIKAILQRIFVFKGRGFRTEGEWAHKLGAIYMKQDILTKANLLNPDKILEKSKGLSNEAFEYLARKIIQKESYLPNDQKLDFFNKLEDHQKKIFAKTLFASEKWATHLADILQGPLENIMSKELKGQKLESLSLKNSKAVISNQEFMKLEEFTRYFQKELVEKLAGNPTKLKEIFELVNAKPDKHRELSYSSLLFSLILLPVAMNLLDSNKPFENIEQLLGKAKLVADNTDMRPEIILQLSTFTSLDKNIKYKQKIDTLLFRSIYYARSMADSRPIFRNKIPGSEELAKKFMEKRGGGEKTLTSKDLSPKDVTLIFKEFINNDQFKLLLKNAFIDEIDYQGFKEEGEFKTEEIEDRQNRMREVLANAIILAIEEEAKVIQSGVNLFDRDLRNQLYGDLQTLLLAAINKLKSPS